MPEPKGKENVFPPTASPKGRPEVTNGQSDPNSPQSTPFPSSPGTNGSTKSKRSTRGKMVLARVHMLDGTEADFSVEVNRNGTTFSVEN